MNNELLTYGLINTAFGTFGFVARGERLIATFLPDTTERVRRVIKSRYPEAVERRDGFEKFRRDVAGYFTGHPVRFDVPIDLDSFDGFARRVLETCRRIPPGETKTYAQLAKAAGSAGAARAVGNTMARNLLPLVVPCHRVVRSDGSLGGFSTPQGLTLKEHMLELEGALLISARRTA